MTSDKKELKEGRELNNCVMGGSKGESLGTVEKRIDKNPKGIK